MELRSDPSFGEGVFDRDLKLPAEICLASLVCSRDITRPLNEKMLRNELYFANNMKDVLTETNFVPWFVRRSDVFALAVENDCFREIGAELLDELIEYCAKKKTVEQTAYFLELKKRKFGFTESGGGDGLEL